ncbi:hypothetical protein C8Q76DRAFT_859848 [Earliella scabrosa]|nr:hypothetical protein C8Q76DRAFT_859848 [Earliella scabrosa]
MTAVITSSRSSTMSRPSTPPAAASVVDEGTSGMSTAGVSYGYPQANNTNTDHDFKENHLRLAPHFDITADLEKAIDEIRTAGNCEVKTYKPCSQLLTHFSKTFYRGLSKKLKSEWNKRVGLAPTSEDGYITFIDHHLNAPTLFPDETLCTVADAPDLLGVVNVKDFSSTNDVYKEVPHHRVEAIVEGKSQRRGGGRAQASAYAYRHHQARPDHPMVYCLVVKPQWYQVILSSPDGVVASDETKWEDLSLLAGYVYSHYNPPSGHILYDPTIACNPGEGSKDLPTWTITFKDQKYTDGSFLFIGEPWGRGTTVFQTHDAKGRTIIIKDLYRHFKRRFQEEAILSHIHADGDVPGVVRLKGAEIVMAGSRPITYGSEEDGTLRIKYRLALWDHGERLLQARSVNDFLEAIYDALEVHRTLLKERSVLHRDMSIYNILMYPKWAALEDENRSVLKNAPPFIQDILGGAVRPLEKRIPACLTIDADNAARLDLKDSVSEGELMHRTGTPMYIARSVCLGLVLDIPAAFVGCQMPTLTGEALRLYIAAHGQARYDLYLEKSDLTSHGCIPPKDGPLKASVSSFSHRPEHDVESTFWTTLSGLLRFQPVDSPREEFATKAVAEVWRALHVHEIPNDPANYYDQRHAMFGRSPRMWLQLFPDEMKDVAILLYNMSNQVVCEYALWEPQDQLEIDHLHEALQRLILQYLVDHRDKPIPLDTEHPRPTKAKPEVKLTDIVPASGGTKTTAGTSSGNGNTGSQRVGRLASTLAGSSTLRQYGSATRSRAAKPAPVVTGPSTSSNGTRSRRSANARPKAVVADPKRKTESQGGRSSKRRKGPSGSAVSTHEDDDGGHA